MKVLCREQYTAEWHAHRRGKPTASNASKIVTPKTLKYSASARKYIYQLIGDLYDPHYPRLDAYQSPAMEHGHVTEDPARKNFSFVTGKAVHEVGLCCDDAETLWGSPDGIVTATGEPLEIKSPTPGVHVGYLWDGGVPDTYIPQLHAEMLICGTDSAWFTSYCPGFPDLHVHYQATKYLQALKDALPQFHDEYNEVLDKIKAENGDPPELAVPEPATPEPEDVAADIMF